MHANGSLFLRTCLSILLTEIVICLTRQLLQIYYIDVSCYSYALRDGHTHMHAHTHKHTRTHAHTHAHTHTHTHAHTRTHTHTHAHTLTGP